LVETTFVLTAVLFATFMLSTSYVVLRDPTSRFARALRMDPGVRQMPPAIVARVRRREQWSMIVTLVLLLATTLTTMLTQTPVTAMAYPVIASVAVGRSAVLIYLDGTEATRAAGASDALTHRITPPRLFDRVPIVPWALFVVMTVVTVVSYVVAAAMKYPERVAYAAPLGATAILAMIGAWRFARWLVRQPSQTSDPTEGKWVDALRTETLVWATSASFPIAMCIGTLVPDTDYGSFDITLNLATWYFIFFWALRTAARMVRPVAGPEAPQKRSKKKV
jgi:hypothetical protein